MHHWQLLRCAADYATFRCHLCGAEVIIAGQHDKDSLTKELQDIGQEEPCIPPDEELAWVESQEGNDVFL